MRRGRPPHDDILTPREWQVLALLAERRTNPEIATALGITTDGVKYHVSQILAKLGVESREEAGRLHRTHRPKQPLLVASLFGLRRRVPGTPSVLSMAGVLALVLLIAGSFLLIGNGGIDESQGTDDASQAIGLDVPPEEDVGAAANPAAGGGLPNTLLLTKGTPANTGSGAAAIAAMRRLANVAELEAALTDSVKLIVVDRSALDEVRNGSLLRRQLETKRIIMGLNISTTELAALSEFLDVVSGGCPAPCPDFPGIRPPSMPERGFYSFLFHDRSASISPSLIGQDQRYFFEELFNDEVVELDAGHRGERPARLVAPSDYPSERIDVNRGMGCAYNDVKVAEAAKREVMRQVTTPIFGMSVFACKANPDGTVEIRVLAHRPVPGPVTGSGCTSTPVISPVLGCAPVPPSSAGYPPIVFSLPVSELRP